MVGGEGASASARAGSGDDFDVVAVVVPNHFLVVATGIGETSLSMLGSCSTVVGIGIAIRGIPSQRRHAHVATGLSFVVGHITFGAGPDACPPATAGRIGGLGTCDVERGDHLSFPL